MSCCGSRSDYHYTILSQGDFFEKIPADMFLTTNHKNLNITQKYIFVKENLSAGSVADDKLNGDLNDHVTKPSNDSERTCHVSDKFTDCTQLSLIK